MSEITRLVIAALVCFRLSELITVDDGPNDMLLKMRARLGAYYIGADGKPVTSLGRGIICAYCVGIWIAALLALMLFPIGFMTPVYWLAIAGGQALLQSIGGRV